MNKGTRKKKIVQQLLGESAQQRMALTVTADVETKLNELLKQGWCVSEQLALRVPTPSSGFSLAQSGFGGMSSYDMHVLILVKNG